MNDAELDQPLNNPEVPTLAGEFIDTIFHHYRQEAGNPLPGFRNRQERRTQLTLSPFPERPRDLREATEELIAALEHDSNLRHPRYFGFIPGPAQSVSWLGDVIATAYNSHAGGWRLGPGASATEKQVVAWACAATGLAAHPRAGGLLVSGGSVAGLTALTAARDAHLSVEGIANGVAYLTDQTHSCLAKALHIIGIPAANMRIVARDEHYRMRVDDLEAQIAADRAAGRTPFVVIGTCGTTNTGAVDPLAGIADVCEREGLWFHVDGAYGASVVLSDRRDLAAGIERADSIAWDGHKWLYQIYGCALTLVKDVRTLQRSYTAGGEYLQDIEGEAVDPDWWDLGPELTRPARGPRLWLSLQAAGTALLADMVTASIEGAERFERRLREGDRLDIVTPASLAIVTFTTRGDDPVQVERQNQALAAVLRETNTAGIFTTELDGRNVLRLCTISPEEGHDDIDEVVDQLTAAMDDLGL